MRKARRISGSRSDSRPRAVQIISQDNGGGDVVERRLFPFGGAPGGIAARAVSGTRGGQRLVRFPRTQPLIHHFHGKAKGFLDARRKTLRFFRHFARRAVQVQRQPNDNEANSLLANQFAQPGEIAAPVDPGLGRVRPGSHAKFIRERQSQPLFSIVDRENHTRSSRVSRQGHSTEGNRHGSIITRKEDFSEARVLRLLQ